MAERIGWEAEFESEGPDERLDGMAETALFRIVQEALANVAKHADSPKVRVAFRRERDALHLEVRDWGRGFGVPDKPERGRHVGLLGMRERAALDRWRIHRRERAGRRDQSHCDRAGGAAGGAADRWKESGGG